MARVMIVDDSPTDLLKLKQILESAGHIVLAASNGADALERIRHAKPDCVLMDVVMPGINGFAATRSLSKDPETAGIPIIVVSSKSADSDRQWALRQGARDYLIKPVGPDDLLAMIAQVLDAR